MGAHSVGSSALHLERDWDSSNQEYSLRNGLKGLSIEHQGIRDSDKTSRVEIYNWHTFQSSLLLTVTGASAFNINEADDSEDDRQERPIPVHGGLSRFRIGPTVMMRSPSPWDIKIDSQSIVKVAKSRQSRVAFQALAPSIAEVTWQAPGAERTLRSRRYSGSRDS